MNAYDNTIIIIKNLHKHFGHVKAVDNVSMQVGQGEG